jgi:hypothetical protein
MLGEPARTDPHHGKIAYLLPFEVGQVAVDALVGTGHVILGVGARERHDAAA